MMRQCPHCGRVKFYSINFIFSPNLCNECYMIGYETAKDKDNWHDNT
jgi:hypothetical protein